MYLWIIGLGLAVGFAGLFALYNPTNGLAATMSGSISGVVWQDYCAFDCDAGSSLKRGNGIVNPAERRLAKTKDIVQRQMR
jgi:hypothetical protein